MRDGLGRRVRIISGIGCCAIALILAVVVEIQAGLTGLGFNIMIAQRLFRTPELYAGILLLGLVGFVMSQALMIIEKRLLRWRTLSQ